MEIYKKLTATYPTKVKQIYKTVYRITVMSSLCAMFSLCIMAIIKLNLKKDFDGILFYSANKDCILYICK